MYWGDWGRFSITATCARLLSACANRTPSEEEAIHHWGATDPFVIDLVYDSASECVKCLTRKSDCTHISRITPAIPPFKETECG